MTVDKKKRMVTVRKAYGNPKIFRGKNFSKENFENKLLARNSYRTATVFLQMQNPGHPRSVCR